MLKQIIIVGALLVFSVFIFTGIQSGGPLTSPNLSDQQNTASIKPDKARIRTDEEDISGMFRSKRNSSQSRGKNENSFGNVSRQQTSKRQTRSANSLGLGFTAASSTATSTEQSFVAAGSQEYSNLPSASTSGSAFQPSAPESRNGFVPQNNSGLRKNSRSTQQSEQSATRDNEQAKEKPIENPREPEPEQQSEKQNTNQEASQTDGNTNGIQTDISIEGRVLTRDGKTINEIPLELVLLRATTEDRSAFGNQKRQSVSNESGKYTFSNLVSGDYRICTAVNSYYEKACIQAHAPLLTADFALRPINGARIFGVITNSDGELMSGVRVSATQQSKSVKSNEKGEYSFDLVVSPNRSYLFYYNLQNYERFRFSLKSDEIVGDLQKDIVMERLSGVSVPISVQDESGSPLKSQRVTIYSSKVKSTHALACSTNVNGQCEIKNVKPSDDYKVRVRPKGPFAYKSPITDPVTVSAAMSAVVVSLERTGEGAVSAQITSDNGTPLSGIIMSLRSSSQYVGRQTSDSGGYILFEGVPAGSLRFYSDADPKYTISGSGLKLNSDQYRLDVTLIIDRGDFTQNIEVSDENGPLGGADASLTWNKDYDKISSITRFSKNKISDKAFGLIEFSNLGGGKHTLRVSKSGYEAVSKTIDVGVEEGTTRITLKKK